MKNDIKLIHTVIKDLSAHSDEELLFTFQKIKQCRNELLEYQIRIEGRLKERMDQTGIHIREFKDISGEIKIAEFKTKKYPAREVKCLTIK